MGSALPLSRGSTRGEDAASQAARPFPAARVIPSAPPPMDTPRRKVIVRARQGDVIIFSESPDGGEVFVRIKRAGANGKAGAAPKPWKWSDKLRAIYEAATDKPQSREEVMARAGYARDTHAHELFRRLVKAGWLLEAAGLVRKNPEPPGEPPG